MIVQFSDLQRQKDYKESIVMSFLIGYYKDLNDTGVIDIPYFIRARETYNQIIHSYKDLNYYYDKINSKEKRIKGN